MFFKHSGASSAVVNKKPVFLMVDGDSKAGAPLQALLFGQCFNDVTTTGRPPTPWNALVQTNATQAFNVGGSGTGITAGPPAGLTNPTRMAATMTAVAARIARGFIVDMWLTAGTNDNGLGITPAQTVANIGVYYDAFKAAGGRNLIVMSIDPRTGGTAWIISTNRGLFDFCNSNNDAIFCDTGPSLLDQTVATYGPIGGGVGGFGAVMLDGLHCGGFGMYSMRLAVARVAELLYGHKEFQTISRADIYNSVTAPRANINGANGRFTALGGVAGCTGGVETGTPPLGWTSSGALNGIDITWSQVNCAEMVAYCNTAPAPQCVRVTFNNLPAGLAQLNISQPIASWAAGGNPIDCYQQDFLAYASAMPNFLLTRNIGPGFSMQMGNGNVAADCLPPITGWINQQSWVELAAGYGRAGSIQWQFNIFNNAAFTGVEYIDFISYDFRFAQPIP